MVPEEWPEIFIGKPFLRVQDLKHGANGGEGCFEDQGIEAEIIWHGRNPIGRQIGGDAGPDTLAPEYDLCRESSSFDIIVVYSLAIGAFPLTIIISSICVLLPMHA